MQFFVYPPTTPPEQPEQQLPQQEPTPDNETPSALSEKKDLKFYMLQVPKMTSDLVANNTDRATQFYKNQINEVSAEIWLHRGMSSLTYEQGQTMDPNEADVFLIPGYMWCVPMSKG